MSTTNCSETSLQEEVSNANYIHNEVTTTNEESIKDVQDAQSSLMKAIQILTDFSAKAGEGNDLTQQNQFSETHYTLTRNASRVGRSMWSQIYNGNQMIGTNAISFLQVIQNDFARLESKTTEAESEAVCIFDEFTGKTVEGVWDSVETDTYDSHRRENSTRVILNTLSVIQDIDQRIRPTVVQAGAYVTLEDYEDTLHKWLGRINSYLLVL